MKILIKFEMFFKILLFIMDIVGFGLAIYFNLIHTAVILVVLFIVIVILCVI